ncbi:MAG TPA: SDR family NAD(P)-dependent oxidoreductase, partial [Pyrinomonadaceae bacterium]|nr:SDR family NAD(P)-dependent oxidoreductase [Pyrinomonadaceae bacterium]
FEKRLVAFVVVQSVDAVVEIKEFLRARLAPHMVPAEFNVVDEIPITSNGKVDRKALFERKAASAKTDVAPASALTDTEKILASVFAELLGIESVATNVNLFDLGVTSLHIVRAHNRLRMMLAETVPIILFFKYPTIKSLAGNLKQSSRGSNGVDYAAGVAEDSPARDLNTSNDIAVIGMSCRFPGARNVNEFLRNLRDGVESMSEFSEEELLASGISPELLRRPDYVKAGSVLDGIDEFDAGFFGISPREAEMTDPQQRIFLETAWEAFEDAGCDPQQYRGSIGVFAGANLSTYLLCNFNTRFANTIPGLPLTLANDKDYLATRVSYKLNLRGPSLTVQTACSTSLVAIHVACQNLLTGDCDLALAGGITINVPHKTGYQYQAGGPVSPDGHCRPFDAHAQGTVLGNGVGIIVLKRLDDAVRDGDRIVAVIKGSAINNDGAGKVGFTAPSVDGQSEVIAAALKRAGVGPETIGYVETHGTATPLGDPIEIEALSRAFGSERLSPSSCAIGSVKSNLGHLDSAAGVAGFIKAALSLQVGELFPSLNYSEPNPQIDFERTPFYVNSERVPWVVDGGKRRAGVSSFGIGGTNAHVVLEEWRESGEAEKGGQGEAETYVLPLSARDGAALRELATLYVEHLNQSELTLRDLTYSASVRRAHHRERVAVVGGAAAELRTQLKAFVSDEPAAGVFAGKPAGIAGSREPGVVYVFSGQGAQWWGMGRELAARFPEFRASLAECDELLWQRTHEWRLLEELERGAEETRLDGEEIELTQCALFALQVSLARLWSSFGVRPTAVVGHSMGEVAAAVAAGVLTLAEGVEVIYERSRLLRKASGRGAMAAVELSEEEAEAAVASVKLEKDNAPAVSVAAVNGKRASVVSGQREAVQQLVQRLEARGVMTRELRSSGVAGHSAEVADISEELVQVLGGMRGHSSDVRLVSTVLGRAVAGEEVDASYWGWNVREPVRFRAAMQQLARSGDAVYVEMNAHPVLGLWIREAMEEATQDRNARSNGNAAAEPNVSATVVAALRRERSDTEVTLTGLAELYAAGVTINWEAVWREQATRSRYISLPTYPWQRRRYWVDESNIEPQKANHFDGFSRHPLLGKRITSPLIDDFVFESHFSVATTSLLNDHRVYGVPIVPATVYIELALAAASEVFKRPVALEDFVIQGPMILPENDSRTVQVVIGTEREGASSFRIFSRTSATESSDNKWTLHASGTLVTKANATHEHFPLTALQSRIVEPVPLNVLATRTSEVEYGPAFQGIKGIWSGNREALGYIELSEAPDAYRFHPALLDLCFQVVEAVRTDDSHIYLPLSIERARYFAPPAQAVWSYTHIRPEENSETLAADVVIFDENGSVIAEVEELRFKRATKQSLLRGWHGNIDDWFYEVDWKPIKSADTNATDAGGRWLILADHTDFAGELSDLLKSRGGDPAIVTSAEHFTDLINSDPSLLRGVVDLWSTGSSPDENTSSDTIMQTLRSCCERVLHLLRDVVAVGTNDVPRLTIVTRGAQQPASPSSLVQSSLWGLGRTIALEHPELNVSLIDLPEIPSAGDAQNVLDQLLSPADQVSFRNGERHVARLVRRRNMQLPDPIALRDDATYLITGAFGGIGPKLVRWMFENGARHFVLISRRGPSTEVRLLLDELESEGAKILVGQADVSNVEQLASVLAKAASQMPPLRGVVHAALVLDDGVLLKLGWESFERVFAPKAAGAWNLHLLTRETPLDFFVCFSSVLALIGGSGQANYAAASTFVDALAHYRHAAGLPALSINWGPWSFAGSASLEVIEQHSQLYDGFTSIPVESGFEVLGRLLPTTQTQIGVMPFDAAQWGELYPAVGVTFLAGVIDEDRKRIKTRSRKEVPTLTNDALLKAAPSDRQRLLGEYLQGIIARRLGVSASTLDLTSTFISLGLDSLMMLEIRNRIVDDLGLIIPPVKFIENPSVAQLTTAAYERWLEVNGPTEGEPDLDELRSRLPTLSDEEVELSLQALLATM